MKTTNKRWGARTVALVAAWLLMIAFVSGCSTAGHTESTSTIDAVQSSVDNTPDTTEWETKADAEEEESETTPIVTLEKLQGGDFSAFAGTYVATEEDVEYWREHLDDDSIGLNNLTLRNDGTLVWGEDINYYSVTPLTSVSMNEDGSYLCKWDDDEYYTIYPAGIIEDNEVVRTHQAYLKDVVYIVAGGPASPTTYYSPDSGLNKKPSFVIAYEGLDWVSQEDFTDELGETFVSGTGVVYTVIAIEDNSAVGGGRVRVVLMSEDGEKRMIANLPAFKLDIPSGISYVNIVDYVSNPNYAVSKSL